MHLLFLYHAWPTPKINPCGSSACVTCYANEETYLTYTVTKIFNDFHMRIQNLPLKQENLSWKQKDSPQASCHEGIIHCPLYFTSDANVSADLWDTRACGSGKLGMAESQKFNFYGIILPRSSSVRVIRIPTWSQGLAHLLAVLPACELRGKGFWYVAGLSKQTGEGSVVALFISP